MYTADSAHADGGAFVGLAVDPPPRRPPGPQIPRTAGRRQALARRTAEEDMAEIVAEIYAKTGGPPTEEERAWARRELGIES